MPSMVVAGGVKEVEAGVAELEGVAVAEGDVGEGGVGLFADVDAGSGALGELVVAGDEVGVEVGFDDVFDAEISLAGEVEVEVDVALGVDDGGDAFTGDDVRCVGETAKEELLDEDWFHRFHTVFQFTSVGIGWFLSIGCLNCCGGNGRDSWWREIAATYTCARSL